MNNSLFSEIERSYDGLSKSRKRLASFILNNYEKAAYMTAARLADAVGVSEATAVRFASCLGFEGYPEFQRALQKAVIGRLTSVQRMELLGLREKGEDIFRSALNADIAALKETTELVSAESFEGAARALNEAEKIYVLGLRSCAPLAAFMHFYLKMLYGNTVLTGSEGSGELFDNIFRISKKDVCVAISFPRYSAQVVKALRYVKDRGAKIIVISDSADAPPAPFADFLLRAKTNNVSFTDSLAAPMSLINALIIKAASYKKEGLEEDFSRLEEIWASYDVYEAREDADDE